NPKFKVYLAQRLWELHERDNVLAPGYTGPSDPRLVEFIGEIWMRRNYGSQLGQTVLDLAEDQDAYGPGWNTRVFATGGVRHAVRFVQAFLATLPAWSADVTTFLDACKYISRNTAATGGVVFQDPLDGAEIRWNPIKREKKNIPVFDKLHVEANLSGVHRRVGRRRMFRPQPWRVDRRELSQMLAPCLVHTLDAYFNALVIGRLYDR